MSVPSIQYLSERGTNLSPDVSLGTYTPTNVDLSPNQSQTFTDTTLPVPSDTAPGSYFLYETVGSSDSNAVPVTVDSPAPPQDPYAEQGTPVGEDNGVGVYDLSIGGTSDLSGGQSAAATNIQSLRELLRQRLHDAKAYDLTPVFHPAITRVRR